MTDDQGSKMGDQGSKMTEDKPVTESPSLPVAEVQAHSSWSPDCESPARLTEDTIIGAISTVYDPEIPVNIYELGLIYAIDIHDDGRVHVEMTLTAPACPSAQELPEMVRDAIACVEGVTDVEVETVWDPPWDMSRMSEEARLQLNMF